MLPEMFRDQATLWCRRVFVPKPEKVSDRFRRVTRVVVVDVDPNRNPATRGLVTDIDPTPKLFRSIHDHLVPSLGQFLDPLSIAQETDIGEICGVVVEI